jgi:hypothetical protein
MLDKFRKAPLQPEEKKQQTAQQQEALKLLKQSPLS